MKSTEEKELALTQKVLAERTRHAEAEADGLSPRKWQQSYDRVTAAKTALREHLEARRVADDSEA